MLAETKIDSSFTNPQFFMENYYEPTRKDFNLNSGGLIEYIKKGIIRKRLPDFELPTFESITSEIMINKEKYVTISFYRSEREENNLVNIRRFFKELSTILSKVFEKYDNIILMGDLNIDLHNSKCQGYKELLAFMDTFSLTNLIKDKTCFF